MAELAWLPAFDDGDRAQFFTELAFAAKAAEASLSPEPLEICLRAWRVTAEALSDLRRRVVLTGPGDEDYGEVPRPE